MNLAARIRTSVRTAGTITAAAWTVVRGRAIILAVAAGVEGLGVPAAAYLSKRVVDSAQAGAQTALLLGLAYLTVWLVSGLATQLWQRIAWDVGDRLGQHFQARLLHAATTAPGLEHLESKDYAENLHLVRSHVWLPMNLVSYVGYLAQFIIGLTATVALLVITHASLAVAPLLVLPAAILQYRSYTRYMERVFGAVPDERLQQLYLHLGTSPEAAKEARIFGLRDTLLQRHHEAATRALRTRAKAQLRTAPAEIGTGLLQGLAMALGMVWAIRLAATGRATSGDLIMALQLLLNLLLTLGTGLGMVSTFAQLAGMMRRYLWLLDYRSPVQLSSPSEAVQPPERIADCLVLEGVSFTYPGTDVCVLEDVNLRIPAGTTVAFVGENGAGKTTLVKLLCRFYDPTSGRITVDGTDLRSLDLVEWRTRSTAMFQDFGNYDVLVRESIGLGDPPRMADLNAVGAAVARAGADPLIATLPKGLDTPLGRTFPDGTEISEGQRQVVALGRAAMRDEPILVILDEPTASLDAKVEAEVFRRFVTLAEGDPGRTPITLLISHRFSTVRMADLIVVMHECRIEAVGTHEELMASGGRYAELYRMQASRYE